MARYVIFVLSALQLSTVITQSQYPRDTKQYRPDYVYNRQTDAFYKLHIESRHRGVLDDLCKVEGAALMSPASDKDIIQLHGMFKKYPDLGEYVWVADDGIPHESAEEQPIIDMNPSDDLDLVGHNLRCIVVTREGDVAVTKTCYQRLPFVCKISAADAPYDPHCGVYAKGYKYYASVGSCYKIPRIAYTWSEAYSECQAEGAHLVVINSETEHEVVQNITNTEEKVDGAKTSWFFFAGFRANKPPGDPPANVTRVFKTIFNQTLKQAGYSHWSENEPNNAQGREYCGSIFKNNGLLNDVDCTHEYGFICEKEIHII